MIEIKHRYTNNVLYACNADNLKEAVEEAVKNDANLIGANLYGEKLTKKPLFLYNLKYWCLITEKHMKLGCKVYTHEEWANFTDDEISEMDTKALEFRNVWKEPLLTMCKTHRGES